MKMLTLVLSAGLFVTGVAVAQNYGYEGVYDAAEVAPQSLPKVKGVVRLVDLANSKIKIKHEEIPNLNMPPMTMTFAVADLQMLEGLANGDKVLFTADMVNSELTVMWLEKQL